jgi:hypothetical protein
MLPNGQDAKGLCLEAAIMSHERTVGGLIKDIEHLTGVRVRLVRHWGGWFLEDTETGNDYALGDWKKWDTLLPEEQASICRGLYRDEWIVLLQLGPADD